jgi:sugar (pentulose or hexulose) kinase
MAAGLAAGIYTDFDAASAGMVRIEKVVEPNPAMKPVYDEVFERYKNAYDRLND